ncbi:MAG: organomercurial lyase [Bacteroidota bacterium]
MNHSTLHHAIISSFLERQRPPSVAELAEHFGCDEPQVRDALQALAAYHGVVLHPTTQEVWVAHPFSSAPTTCVVCSGGKAWWGNCAWCSLGLVHLAGGTGTIETRIGAIGEQVTLRFEDGDLVDRDFVIHFPIPMREAWDNVLYTCSVMLLFRNEEQVDAWCETRGVARGDVRPIQQIWHFASEWYARHADVDWTKWSAKEAADLFQRHSLSGPIWALSETQERF